MLTALGCKLAEFAELAGKAGLAGAPKGDTWLVTLPSWRLDVEREIDLIEEVARVYGYNRFANTLPTFGGGVHALPWAQSEEAVRRTLRSAGFHEAIASTFCSATEAALTAPQPGLVVPLGNPLSEEAGVMRPSLVPGMLTMIAGNLHRDVSDVRLFELGTVFSGTTEKVDERPAVAFGAVGSLPEQSALHPARAIEFHDIKGAVEQVLARFQARSVYFDRFPGRVRNYSRVAASLPLRTRNGRWHHGGLVRPIASPRGCGAQAEGTGAGGRALSGPALQAAVAKAELARDLPLPAGSPRFLSDSEREHCVGKDRPGAGRFADSRAGGVAGARSLPRCQAGRARVLRC